MAGSYVRDKLSSTGAAGVRNPDLASTMLALGAGALQLPRRKDTLDVPIARLSELGDRGPILWANTTFGLMSFWWKGSRERASMTLSRQPELPVLDPRQLGEGQIQKAHEFFAEFQRHPLLPANEAYRHPVRADLDRAVLVRLLGLPEGIEDSLWLLRNQWCAEPSVHGGKSTRIRD